MAASYKKLFKLMIDREIKSKDLASKEGISPTTLSIGCLTMLDLSKFL